MMFCYMVEMSHCRLVVACAEIETDTVCIDGSDRELCTKHLGTVSTVDQDLGVYV